MRAALLGLALLATAGLPALAQTGTADRLYVMDCGHNAATDQSRWSPGVNVGKPIELSDNCYLIRHGSDWLLWDTGYPDAIAEKPVTGAGRHGDARQDAGGAARRGRRQAGGHPLRRGLAPSRRSRRQRRHVPELDAPDAEGRVRLRLRARQEAAVQGRAADPQARGRPRRVRRRQRDHHLDAGPHARPPVTAGAPAQDRAG